MNKPHLLRTELTGKIPYLRDNPEYLHLGTSKNCSEQPN